MTPNYPDYTTFQTEDFVLDDSFQAFATGSDATAAEFWPQWLAAHPAQQPAAEQARHLVVLLSRAQQPVASAQRKEQDLRRLRQAIRQPQPTPLLRAQRLLRRHLVGSLVLLLCALGAAGSWLWPAAGLRQQQYAAGAGEHRTVRLPDGSVVVLNGNSRLTTAASWDAQSPREVWLEGEAFFRVSHLTQVPNLPVAQATGNAKFVVHAGELNVSVVGTTFNVINRPAGVPKVTLNSGKVLVEHATLFGHDELLMAPGELVEYDPSGSSMAKRPVEPARFSAWVNNSLEFDHTPMSEIIRLFRDTYGLELVVNDPALLRQTVTGSMPSKSADILLEALAKSLGARAERLGSQVYLLPLK